MNDKTEVQETTTAIAEYSKTEAALAELRERYENVQYDVSNPKLMREAKEARAEIRRYRLDLESTRKVIKAPALERCQLIDSEAKRIKEQLEALEKPIAEQIDAEVARVKAEEEAKAEAERQRVEAIEAAIDEIAHLPDAVKLAGASSDQIHEHIVWLLKRQDNVAEWAQESEARARNVIAVIKDRMAELEQDTIKAEAEAAELERLREEAAERERMEAERRAEEAAQEAARKQEELERANRERAVADRITILRCLGQDLDGMDLDGLDARKAALEEGRPTVEKYDDKVEVAEAARVLALANVEDAIKRRQDQENIKAELERQQAEVEAERKRQEEEQREREKQEAADAAKAQAEREAEEQRLRDLEEEAKRSEYPGRLAITEALSDHFGVDREVASRWLDMLVIEEERQ